MEPDAFIDLLICREGWDLIWSKESLILKAPSQRSALKALRSHCSQFACWAQAFGLKAVLIRYAEDERPYRIPAIMSTGKGKGIPYMTQLLILSPEIQVAEMKLSLPLARIIAEFLEFPERKCGVIRLSDERQVILSASSAALIHEATLEEAVRRKRQDYWYEADLADVNQRTRQELEPNNPNSFLEFTWRGVDKTKTMWRRFTNRYRLVQDNAGQVYQVSESLAAKPITAPLR